MSASVIDWIWPLMIAGGVLTFLIRFSFIAAEGHYRAPEWFVRLLPFVPIAMLTALTVPDIALIHGQFQWGLENPRFGAGLVAIVVAGVWRNTLLTIGAGFIALVALRALA